MENGVRLVFSVVLAGLSLVSTQASAQIPKVLRLETVLKIDSEAPENAARGLSDITRFTVGRKGQVYIFDPKNKDQAIFLFDEKGAFIKAFGKRGQGPGEIQLVGDMMVDNNGVLILNDVNEKKLIFFDTNGAFIKEKRIPDDGSRIIPLDNGRFFVCTSQMTNESVSASLRICDGENREVKAIDQVAKPNIFYSNPIEARFNLWTLAWGSHRAFFGFPGRDEIIRQYDESGNLVREIRAGVRDAGMTEKYKSDFIKIIAPIYEMIKDKLVFPKSLPPYHSFTAGPNDELAVMTYEWNEGEKGFKYLFFSGDGQPLGIAYLDAAFNDGEMFVKMGDGKIYYLREKPSGYKELVVAAIR